MEDEFAVYAVARRLIRDHGADALQVALEVADLPYVRDCRESLQLWRDIAEAVTRLLAQPPASLGR